MSGTPTISVKDGAVFKPYEVAKLESIQRFLILVTDASIADDAEKLGYDDEEHAMGWKDYATAAGMQVPFKHHMTTNELALTSAGGDGLLPLLRTLDRFENRWFPRTRTSIRRFVVEDKREAFEAAFFENMAQQPEGPGVVGSVEKYVGRLDGMAKSEVKGAAEAYKSLVKRGLTKTALKQVKDMIAEAKQRQEPLPKPKVDVEAIEAGAAQRRAAYDRVSRWYNDWAETFRSELSYRQLVKLGLIEVKGGSKSGGEETEEPQAPTNP